MSTRGLKAHVQGCSRVVDVRYGLECTSWGAGLRAQAGLKVYTRPAALSFRENKDLGEQFPWCRSFVFPTFPFLYLGLEALFVFCSPAGGYSDRPRVYENQSDLPPNPFPLEKTGALDE